MSAGTYNIVANQGSVFRRVIRYESPDESPIDLTGYSARMHVRKQPYDATPVLELTTENDSIAIDGETGTITLGIPATTMASVPSGTAFYDLELVPPSGEDDAFRLLEGSFTIKREVTREAS